MLEVLLVRHAVAFEPDHHRWPSDDLRPLTPEGIEKFRQTAEVLKAAVERPALVLTSPLLRTRQTAQILTEVAEWPAARESTLLVPSGTSAAVLNLLNKQSDACIALVGHEPNLSELAAVALAGTHTGVCIEMKKGSVLCLEFSGTARAGSAMLKWLLPTRLARSKLD